EQTLQASQIGYQTGTLDFLSLIDSVRAIEQIHLEHLMAAANFELAWAALERAVGKELPRTVVPRAKPGSGASPASDPHLAETISPGAKWDVRSTRESLGFARPRAGKSRRPWWRPSTRKR
ncbi:MAG: TolC family protein, partial [Beggiatoa sp.]|nr:TolC family protein [Beggiatoa sp.]